MVRYRGFGPVTGPGWFLAMLWVGLCFLLVSPSAAASKPRPWRLGVLFWHASPNDEAALEGIRAGLSEQEQPHELIVRQADSDRSKAARILSDFREQNVDLVFALGTEAALLARQHVRDIPVVFTAVTHPVESGVVPSWEGSENNLCGNSNWIGPDTVLRVFRLAVPGLSRLGILRSTESGVVSAAELVAMKDYLRSKDSPSIDLSEEIVSGVESIQPAVKRLIDAKVQAIWIPIDFFVYQNIDEVLRAVRPHHLPLVSSSQKGARKGAVAGIMTNYPMLGKRALLIARGVLSDGKRPQDFPVGTMRGYQVVVNLGAARRCGYEIPLSLLVLADQILEDTRDGKAEDGN